MGAYYVCKLKGQGTEDDPVRPYLADYPVNWVMISDTGKGCLVYCSNPLPEMDTDSQLVPINKDLDATFSRSNWNAFVTKLHGMSVGLSPSDYDPAVTVRDVITRIGQIYDPDFDINHFRVG